MPIDCRLDVRRILKTVIPYECEELDDRSSFLYLPAVVLIDFWGNQSANLVLDLGDLGCWELLEDLQEEI